MDLRKNDLKRRICTFLFKKIVYFEEGYILLNIETKNWKMTLQNFKTWLWRDQNTNLKCDFMDLSGSRVQSLLPGVALERHQIIFDLQQEEQTKGLIYNSSVPTPWDGDEKIGNRRVHRSAVMTCDMHRAHFGASNWNVSSAPPNGILFVLCTDVDRYKQPPVSLTKSDQLRVCLQTRVRRYAELWKMNSGDCFAYYNTNYIWT